MKLRRKLQSSAAASPVQCFPVSQRQTPSSEETWFPDEDFYLASLFTNDQVAAAGSNQPDIAQLLDRDHSHATRTVKSVTPERNNL